MRRVETLKTIPPASVAAGVVARRDDAEPGADARQLVAEEVAAGGEAAALRVARRGGARRRSRRRARSRPGRGGRTPAGTASRWRAPRRERRSTTRRASPRRRRRRRARSACACSASAAIGAARAIVASIASRTSVEAGAAVHHDLAAEQVERLDAVRALVDHVEAVVAPVLLDRKVARVAVAAEHLDRQAVRLQAPLARPALGDRRQHFEQQVRARARRVVAGVQLVDELARSRARARARLRNSSSARAACA